MHATQFYIIFPKNLAQKFIGPLFLSEDNNQEHYICEYPQIPFNESQVTTEARGPSYYPQGWLKRR